MLCHNVNHFIYKCFQVITEEYFTNYHKIMPAVSCDEHRDLFVETKTNFGIWKMDDYPCCVAHNKHEQRTPLLFKYEYIGHYMYALTCKTYHAGCFGDEGQFTNEEDNNFKQSTKGVSKIHSNLRRDDFVHVLEFGYPRTGTNLSFVMKNTEIYTYKQERVGLSYLYYKRKVKSDRYRTDPTDL